MVDLRSIFTVNSPQQSTPTKRTVSPKLELIPQLASLWEDRSPGHDIATVADDNNDVA